MPPAMHPRLLEPAWDGRLLRVSAHTDAALRVAIDGCPFVALTANADGWALLDMPFSPTGKDSVCIRIATDSVAGDFTVQVFGITFGKPGIRTCSEYRPLLAPMGSAERLVPIDAQPMQREVAIVVPVYNNADAVRRCLDSVLAHTTGPSRLIVIDDASPDAAIAPLLDRYRGIAGVGIFANPRNLGFTATVNRGIELAGRADVVLLNADTKVAANWLTGLRRALHAQADVATVTAVSDNAGAFSVPELEQENPIPTCWSFAQAARAIFQNAGLAYPQLPTGNGFCMLIRREVIDAIGLFDVEAFPQGYGEENDFCQRACAAGYRHLIAGDVFVAHARSLSFGDVRREALGRAGMEVLRRRWPRYEADVGATLFSFERLVLDWRVRRLYADAAGHSPLPRVLRFEGNADPLHDSGYDIRMLIPRDDAMTLTRPNGETVESMDAAAFDARACADWLQRHAIERVDIGDDVDATVATMLETQANRLGIAIRFRDRSAADFVTRMFASTQPSFNGRAR